MKHGKRAFFTVEIRSKNLRVGLILFLCDDVNVWMKDCRDSGEDTFGDDETEEDDDEIGGSNGIAVGTGVRPPLAPNVASMVVGIDGPTCNLQDHPIQVRAFCP